MEIKLTPHHIIKITLIDGSMAELLSTQTNLRDTIKWFKGMHEIEIENTFYPRHSIFSWEVVDAKETK